MHIRGIGNSFYCTARAVNFSGTTNVIKTENKNELQKTQPKDEKPKSSLTSKIGKTILSALYPGLGQFANGQWLKAVTFAIGVPTVSTAGYMMFGTPGLIAGTLFHLYNVYDAYKHS